VSILLDVHKRAAIKELVLVLAKRYQFADTNIGSPPATIAGKLEDREERL